MVKRVLAIILRQLYLYKRSMHRVFALFYWPTFELFIWGFLTVYLNRIGAAKFDFIPLLLGGLVFWNLFNRAQQSISVSFLEDIWSRNIGNVFASPIRLMEFLLALVFLSIFQSLISVLVMATLATVFWRLDILQFGPYLALFFLNLFILGWTMGIITTSVIMRFGPSVDILAWSFPLLVQPLSAVFYPVSVLPGFLQKISFLLPTSHVFEGMRAILLGETFLWDRLAWAFGLNVFYFALAVFFFHKMFRMVREKGLLQRHTD